MASHPNGLRRLVGFLALAMGNSNHRAGQLRSWPVQSFLDRCAVVLGCIVFRDPLD